MDLKVPELIQSANFCWKFKKNVRIFWKDFLEGFLKIILIFFEEKKSKKNKI